MCLGMYVGAVTTNKTPAYPVRRLANIPFPLLLFLEGHSASRSGAKGCVPDEIARWMSDAKSGHKDGR